MANHFFALRFFTSPAEGWYKFSRRAMQELLPPPEGPTSASTCHYSAQHNRFRHSVRPRHEVILRTEPIGSRVRPSLLLNPVGQSSCSLQKNQQRLAINSTCHHSVNTIGKLAMFRLVPAPIVSQHLLFSYSDKPLEEALFSKAIYRQISASSHHRSV